MVNAVIRGNENIPSWSKALHADDKINLGGTSSETLGIDFTDQQWKDIAALKCGVCIPCPSNITTNKFYEILRRAISFGVNITDVRYFNEYANKPDFTGVKLSDIKYWTSGKVDDYIYKVAPYRTVVESLLTVTHIYAGIYSDDTQYNNPSKSRFFIYETEWMRRLNEVLSPIDGIDVHVYDRPYMKKLDPIKVKEFFARYTRPMYVIESGSIAAADAIPDTERTYFTWDITHAALGQKDEFSVQLMEQVKMGFGLVWKGSLTHWGLRYLSLPRKTKPRIIKVWFTFGFGSFKWWTLKLSNGQEKLVFSSSQPVEGSIL